MIASKTIKAIETLDSFCSGISQAISSEEFDVRVQPGDHLVDDNGADSLTVLKYMSYLQVLGLRFDLRQLDRNLLYVDTAYSTWLQKKAADRQNISP